MLSLLESADALISPSRYEVQRLISANPKLEKKVTAIPTGVDMQTFHTSDVSRSYYGLSSNAKVVLYCGRMRWTKGIDVLANAFAHVAERDPDSVLLLAGRIQEGATVDRLTARLRSHVDCGRVRLLGPVPPQNLPELYSIADVFVLPSIANETQGIVIAEAMASGVPCIVSALPAIREFIEHEVTGLLIPPGDVIALAEQVLRIFRDKSLCSRIISTALNEVRSSYSMDVLGAAILDLYKGVQDAATAVPNLTVLPPVDSTRPNSAS